MYDLYYKCYSSLQNEGKYRELSQISPNSEEHFIDFSTNDYLGLSKSHDVFQEAKRFGSKFGVGSTGSRLLSGNHQVFEELESQIAKDKATQSALILNSGFQANLTVLATLLDPSVLGAKPLVFFDRLNHSSLYQAVFLARAELVRYPHNDIDSLRDLLIKFQSQSRPKFIVTESLFGMDGDIAPIEEILVLARKHKAFIYLDEAHAIGVLGDRGYGLSTRVDFGESPHLIMGTFSKALGCFGAYVACSEVIKKYLINKCPGFIYSTCLSPMLIGAVTKAWSLVPLLYHQRKALSLKATYLRDELQRLGFNTGSSTTHIIPLILGDESRVMSTKAKLLAKGLIVSAVRPPTVPPGTSRLRIALHSNHSQEDLNYLIKTLKEI